MKNYTVLLRMSYVKPIPNSVNGNPRWRFYARAADGPMEEFKTASDVSSAYGCNLNCVRAGSVIRAQYHETATGTLMVTIWDDSRSSGVDLNSQFDALKLQHLLRADLRDPQTTPSTVRL